MLYMKSRPLSFVGQNMYLTDEAGNEVHVTAQKMSILKAMSSEHITKDTEPQLLANMEKTAAKVYKIRLVIPK